MKAFKTSALAASILALGLSGAALANNDSNMSGDVIDPVMGGGEVLNEGTDGVPAGPGPYAGWSVYSSDAAELGTILLSQFDIDHNLDFIVFALDDGRQVKMDAEDVAAVGEDSLTVDLTYDQVASNALEGMSEIRPVN